MLPPTNLVPSSTAKFPILMSYAFLRDLEKADVEILLRNPHVEVLIDSGAFSALNAGITIELAEYMDFLHEHRDHIHRAIALDVLGDPAATDRNLQIMIENGLRPVPVHVRGDDAARMDELFGFSDYVACGGLRRPRRGPCPKSYLVQKMRWANGRNVHWLGYVRMQDVFALKPYSCDSSSWASAQMYGTTVAYVGGGQFVKATNQIDNVRGKAIHPAIEAALYEAGFDKDDFYNPILWRRSLKNGVVAPEFLSLQLATMAWIKCVRDVRATIGTRIVLACALIHAEPWTMNRWINATLPPGSTPYEVPDEWKKGIVRKKKSKSQS